MTRKMAACTAGGVVNCSLFEEDVGRTVPSHKQYSLIGRYTALSSDSIIILVADNGG